MKVKTKRPRLAGHVLALEPDVAEEFRQVAARHNVTPHEVLKRALAAWEGTETRPRKPREDLEREAREICPPPRR